MDKNIYEYLYGLEKYGILLGLDNINFILSLLGNPERTFPAVHVVGTNGKGSTAAFLSSILKKAGYRTGVYTSPHLVKFSERITINGKKISEKDIERLAGTIREKIKRSPYRDRPFTFFEVTTALCFQYFAEKKIDIAVIEAGLGGRLDATNVLTPLATIITNVGIEHKEFLGNTLEKIAFEKASVIKKNTPCITGVKEKKALAVVENIAKKRNALLYVLGRDVKIQQKSRTSFEYRGINKKNMTVRLRSLVGRNQFENAATAMTAAAALAERGLSILPKHMLQGVRDAVWEGRFEILRKSPPFIIDGAHNPHGVKSLVCNLRMFYPRKKFVFILNVLVDKDINEMVQMLKPLALYFILVPNRNERSYSLQEYVLRYSGKKNFYFGESISAALKGFFSNKELNGLPAVFTGSLYGIGEAKEILDTWHIKRHS